MVKPRLLITRFAPHAQQLADLLNEQGIYSLAQPLLEITPVIQCTLSYHHYDFIIAISTNAVEYTDRSLGGHWPSSCYLAVGCATQSLLEVKTSQSVMVPINASNSEGLLSLPSMQELDNCSVLILRGVGGREFLKEQLIKRGARVDYYEPYQRVAIKLAKSISVHKWQQQAINGVIISSIELLEQLITVTTSEDEAWLKSLTLFVASERILKYAQSLGFNKTTLLPSIANQKIIDYFTNKGSYE